ncbi:hypothetical protein BDA99DRAFT_596715 [Phascolomyces articulosus]|uniref:Uncharacterized protein n=1 Tax=Phascolomyces articulosus TaxID=60185 RepID=A0AAD5JK04_9FUNG|nr:hypothetical protein BDA99DRAFT_596715 [Phascolomyces articulosus]
MSSSSSNNNNTTNDRRQQHAHQMHLSSMRDRIYSLEDAQSQLHAENVAMKIQLNGMAASRVATQQQTDVIRLNTRLRMFKKSSHNQEVLNIISAFCKGSPDGCVLNDRDLRHQIWVFFDGQKKISRLTPKRKSLMIKEGSVIKEFGKLKLQYHTKIERQHRESLKEHYDGGEKLLRIECMSPEVSDDDSNNVLHKQKLSFHNANVDEYFKQLDMLYSSERMQKE